MGTVCLGFTVSEVSTRKMKEWGLARQLRARVIWRCFHSQVWRPVLAVGWGLSEGCWPEQLHVASPCSLVAWAPVGCYTRLRGWWLSTLKARGPVDELEVALPFLSQSQKSGRGPDPTSVHCTPRFKGRGHDPPLEGRVGKVTLQGNEGDGSYSRTCCRDIQGHHNYSSGITLFSSQIGSLHSSQTEVFCSFQRTQHFSSPPFPGFSPFSTMAVCPAQSPAWFSSSSRSTTFSGKMFTVCWVPFSGELCLSVYLRNGLHIVWFITVPSPSLICQLLQHRGSFLTPNI